MPPLEKELSSVPFATYWWVIFLSAWGGVVGWIRKRNQGISRPFNIAELIGEIVISAFAGILTFLICEASGTNSFLEAALVGISGHMGSTAIFGLETIFTTRFSSPVKTEDKKSDV